GGPREGEAGGGGETRRGGTHRTRPRAQERAAPRRDPATRRTSLPPRACAGLLPRPATGRRAPLFRPLASRHAADCLPPWPRAMLRRTPAERRAMTRLEPPYDT